MSTLAFTKELQGTVDEICGRVSEAIKLIGFGVLTRIDLDQKINEKLGETIPRTVVLGACNPKLVFEAFKQSTDVALLIPCNIVVRDLGAGLVKVEAMRPSQMLAFLDDLQETRSVLQADESLKKVIESL